MSTKDIFSELVQRFHKESFIDIIQMPKVNDYKYVILLSFITTTTLYKIVHIVFNKVLRLKVYMALSETKKRDWDSRIIALIHALVITTFSTMNIVRSGFPWNRNEELYTQEESNLLYIGNSISIGYFLWDIMFCIKEYQICGFSFLFHSVFSFGIYIFTYRNTLMAHYAALFLNYEMSTIFLNIYWLSDKCGLTGTMFQLVDGIILLIVFFVVRLFFGIIFCVKLMCDLVIRKICPVSLVIFYSITITSMQILNIIWYYAMIKSLQKRFPKEDQEKKKL